MKTKQFSRVLMIASLLGFFSLPLCEMSAKADAFTEEDTAEFLAEPVALQQSNPEYHPEETMPCLTGGEWSYRFELVRPEKKTLLAESNSTLLMLPASTFKVFTGWWSFQKTSQRAAKRNNIYLNTMLHRSVNEMANQTFKRLGGASSMQEFFLGLGLSVSPYNFIPTDGAGLSYNTKTTVALEMELLEKIYADPGYPIYKNLLAQPKAFGTLIGRLSEFKGKLFAKTGTLAHAAALSGFLETPKGTILFSIISNNLTMSVPAARQEIDGMVRMAYANVMDHD